MASWFPFALFDNVAAAIRDESKLSAALVNTGVFLIASALGLIVSKSPSTVLVTWHGSAASYTYCAVLGFTVVFGVAEVTFGFWVDPRRRWSLAAKILLFVSMAPLAVVLALWAGLKL